MPILPLQRSTLLIVLLVIFYTVGLAGLLIPLHEDFILLTPGNLLLSLGLVLANHREWDARFFIFMAICFLTGFLVEVAGVNWGFLFGSYEYGPVLGWKLWNTPLIIGINWLMLVYCSGVTVQWRFPKAHIFIKTALGALLMVLLDFLIEPVAVHYNFWQWEKAEIPWNNYAGWYLVSFILVGLFFLLSRQKINKVGTVLLILQFIFFGVLNGMMD
jgi:putative membrane protein